MEHRHVREIDKMGSQENQRKVADNSTLRKKLISLYERFVQNPEDDIVLREMREFSGKYGGLVAYEDVLKNPPLSRSVSEALKETSASFQYKMGTFPKEELVKKGKEVLEDLKKNQ